MTPKRWWGIRHVRWLVLSVRFWWWWNGFAGHFFITPNPANLKFLDDVRAGRA